MATTQPLFDHFQPTHYLPQDAQTGHDFLYLTDTFHPEGDNLLVRFTEDEAFLTVTAVAADPLAGWVVIQPEEVQQYHDLLISMLTLPEAVRLLNNYLQP